LARRPSSSGRRANGGGASKGSAPRRSAAPPVPNGNGSPPAGNGKGNGRANGKGNGHALGPNGGPVAYTRLSEAELESFRLMLIEKRRELLGDMRHMEDEALRRTRSDAAGDLSMMPIHMADIGTDAYEQEFTIGLIASERQMLKEIDEALQRIESRTYGICQATHKPITKARLRATPWARYCLEYKLAQEQRERR
jgi:RNA polymerase-binding transcription factor DksA